MIAIQVDAPLCEHLYFKPLGRTIRGTYDVSRSSDSELHKAAAQWPTPIPGQVLRLDGDRAMLEEPLRQAKHTALREQIQRKWAVPPDETFEHVHEATWLYWMARAVQSGIARVVEGKLPTKLPTDAQRHFIVRPRQSDSARLADAIERLMARIPAPVG